MQSKATGSTYALWRPHRASRPRAGARVHLPHGVLDSSCPPCDDLAVNFVNGVVETELDLRSYRLAAVKKAAYRLVVSL